MSKTRFRLPLTTLLAARSGNAADTDRQLRDMLDRNEITVLIDRLGRSLDEGRFEDLRAIYTADATAKTPGGRAAGIDALIAQASRNHSADRKIQHVISNVLIDLDRDTAEARANLIATFAAPTVAGSLPTVEFALGETYRFDAVRTAEGWRLSRVETTPLWSTGTLPR
ncbi:nuclear transport factor 2 family protein [Nocardia sp. NPDC049149]|uniref:nuclear transport factor 2 family protein n=1 Tax=Nocardia sp. NPDC049149 TaxID=3364315 RepID=UPI00371560C0